MLPAIIRRPRFDTPLATIPQEIGDFFENMLDTWRGNGSSAIDTAAYPCDIREENGQICVDAELPGFDKDEVKVTLDNGVLSIRAEHKEERQQKEGGQSYLQERQYRRIQRSFTLPAAVNESKVDASLKNGVLHLKIDKSKESTAHEIAIK